METGFGIEEIQRLLPHRYPFLLIDRVLECVPGERILALKNVTVNEPFFPGHFPGRPVMPGVMMVEAMAQATALLAFRTRPQAVGSIFYFVGMDKVRFRRPVGPGDQVRIEARILRAVRGIWRFAVEARVGEEVVAEGELMATAETERA
ncbi:3-hydroxyacyl-ACP dehydratase FabZ [Inmirania thermothiophila]|uniref:3-hydroxyacyl-[acyl-carrier-protein] dehydratase FabZ n=1 Tax=Inmirania thermothiophila TaxID=1750597 RepID=A0A3N1Y054_9GAMM|nr:3-hydroxyacyl-ACP dehydratase FabZ [Inmirania thermothiophila]ROR32225.1 3-hydroxyacyl-[acyl-carrier-protein] dehydratase [Inmirania thermothiophila]